MTSRVIVASDVNSIVRFRGWLIRDWIYSSYDVHIISLNAGIINNETREFFQKNPSLKFHMVNYDPYSNSVISFVMGLFSFISIFRKIGYCEVLVSHIQCVMFVSASRLFCKFKFVPLITGLGYSFTTQGHGMCDFKRYLFKILSSLIYSFAFFLCRTVVFMNKEDAKDLEKYTFFFPKCVLFVNGSGIDISEYNFCILPRKLTFIMVARLINDKGIREFYQASRIVKRIYPKVHIVLIGGFSQNPSSIDENLKNSILSTGVVEFRGFTEGVRDELSKASCFVLPSYREGLTRSGIEALAIGRPLIVTDVPGCRELVDGGNGILVPPRSYKGLARAMLHFARLKRKSHERMSKSSRTLAVERYSLEVVRKQYSNIFS